MLQSETLLMATSPATAIQRMCKHFSHKVPARWDAQGGHVDFPAGRCELVAGSNTVSIVCRAADAESMATVQRIVSSHVPQLMWRDEQNVTWTASVDVSDDKTSCAPTSP